MSRLALFAAAAVVVLAFVCVARAQQCTPAQWEGYVFTWDDEHHFLAGQNISYDYTNSRLYYASKKFEGDHEYLSTSLYLFASQGAGGKYYWTDAKGDCFVSTLKFGFEQDCIPANATLVHGTTIGGSLPVNVYQWQTANHERPDFFTAVVTASGNVPVQSAFSNRIVGLAVSDVWGVTLGIADTSVFTPPANCKPAVASPKQTGEMMRAFKGW